MYIYNVVHIYAKIHKIYTHIYTSTFRSGCHVTLKKGELTPGSSQAQINIPWAVVSHFFNYLHPDFVGRWSNLTVADFSKGLGKNHQVHRLKLDAHFFLAGKTSCRCKTVFAGERHRKEGQGVLGFLVSRDSCGEETLHVGLSPSWAKVCCMDIFWWKVLLELK